MRLVFFILANNNDSNEQPGAGGTNLEDTTEETVEATGVEGAVEDLTQQGAEDLGPVAQFFTDVYGYLVSTDFIVSVISSVLVVLLGIVVYRVLTHGVPRILRWRQRRGVLDAEAVARIKRQDTAITLVRNALRYVIFIIVALFVLSIFINNPLPATAGATILAAVIGFGAQSFLRDIIAGFSIVFEGQYSVGDFIEVEPTKAAGIVEEFGLRTTKIRALSGELIFIPNGTMLGVRNYVSGQQRFTVEVQLSDPKAVDRVLEALPEASNLYLFPPRLVERDDAEGRVRLRIVAGVLPSMSWLVEETLTERIKAAAGEDALASDPLIYKVDQANLSRIRSLIPEDNQPGPTT
jgi:moderate conductance mechanosensitive channel